MTTEHKSYCLLCGSRFRSRFRVVMQLRGWFHLQMIHPRHIRMCGRDGLDPTRYIVGLSPDTEFPENDPDRDEGDQPVTGT